MKTRSLIAFLCLLPRWGLTAEPNSLDQDLSEALLRQDQTAVFRALEAGANPNGRSGGTPFVFYPASQGNRELLDILIDFGADPLGRTNDNETLLHKLIGYCPEEEQEFIQSRSYRKDLAPLTQAQRQELATHLLSRAAETNSKLEPVRSTNRGHWCKFAADATSREGYTALELAAHVDSPEWIGILAQGPGFDIHQTRSTAHTALNVALDHQSAKAVPALLALGASLLQPDDEGFYPLHFAAKKGNLPLLDLILPRSLETLGKESKKGLNPLAMAAFAPNAVTVAERLTAAGADPNSASKPENLAAVQAIRLKNPAYVQYLVGRSFDLRANGLVGLKTALEVQGFDVAEFLLKQGVDAEQEDASKQSLLAWVQYQWSPYSSDLRAERLAVLKFLAQHKINMTPAKAYDVLHTAIYQRARAEVEALISGGLDLNQTVAYFRPLDYALDPERWEIAGILLKAGARPTHPDNALRDLIGKSAPMSLIQSFFDLGASPLPMGCGALEESIWKRGADRPEVLKFLYARGAPLSCTTLHVAAEKEDFTSVEVVLAQPGLPLNFVNPYGENALFYAKTAKMLQRLIQAGLNVNHINKNGYPLLHSVIRSSSPQKLEQVKVLLAAGVNVDATDAHQTSAAKLASEWKEINILLVLCQAGAKDKVCHP